MGTFGKNEEKDINAETDRALQRRGGVCECPKDRNHGATRFQLRRKRHFPLEGMSRSDRGETVPHNKRAHGCELFCYEVPSRIELLYLVLQTSA